MSRRLIGFAAAVLACAVPLAASAALSKASGKVTLEAKLSPFGSFEGTSNALSVSDDGKELKFSVPVTSVKTGIGGRDADMVKRFGSGSAVLTVARGQIKFPEEGKTSRGSAKGKFSLNGATSDVNITYEASKKGPHYVMEEAWFSFNYPKHHVEDGERGKQACKVGICVEPSLKVSLDGAKFKE